MAALYMDRTALGGLRVNDRFKMAFATGPGGMGPEPVDIYRVIEANMDTAGHNRLVIQRERDGNIISRLTEHGLGSDDYIIELIPREDDGVIGPPSGRKRMKKRRKRKTKKVRSKRKSRTDKKSRTNKKSRRVLKSKK